MSAVTTGGITVKVLTGRTAAPLQRYRDMLGEGQEPPLFMMTRHCSHDAEIQIGEWKATRELHGTQGARCKPRASFERVDPDTGLHASGRAGTHVEYHDGSRLRKRLVREGEMPTHFRVPASELMPVKESEAVHTIYAAGPDLIDPNDHEALERFFLAVCAQRDEELPGIQESRWLERNGRSGLVHVHVASNATIYAAFELDGKQWSAGRKMAQGLTRKDHVRARFEQFLDAHPEYGFRQGLARVGSSEYRGAQLASGQKDYRDGGRGEVSNHERIRLATFDALEAVGVADQDSWLKEMTDRGIEVKEVGLRRGKPTQSHDYSYRVAGNTPWTRGCTLGPQYTHQAVSQQVSRRAAGQAIEPRTDRQKAGPAVAAPLTQRPLSVEEQRELEELRQQVLATGAPARRMRAQQAQTVAEVARLDALDADRRRVADQAAAEQADREAHERQERLEASRRRRDTQLAAALAEHDEATSRLTQLLDPRHVDAGSLVGGAAGDVDGSKSEAGAEAAGNVDDNATPTPAGHQSQLRAVHGRDDRDQRRLDVLIELDESWAQRLVAGERVDATFEQLATEAGVGRKLLDGRIGQVLHPAVRGRLEARELAKISKERAFEWAKEADGDELRARLDRHQRVRDVIKVGDYAAAIRLMPDPGAVPDVEVSGGEAEVEYLP